MSINHNQQYLVSPRPAIVHDELAHIGAGLRFSQSPTHFLAELRKGYGDTFLVDIFGYKLFCVFSPQGLKSLYAAAEDEASFGMATFDMLGFKTPLDIFMDADVDIFYELLLTEKVAAYVKDFSEIIAQVLASWGDSGQINVFDAIRTLEQRVGFKVWIGEEATRDDVWQQFKQHFDVLSQENAFVSPQKTLETLTSGKARDPQVTLRKLTHNIINANQGFLSNLYAALCWSLINLKQHPDTQRRLEAEIAATKDKFGDNFQQSQDALDSMRFCEQLLMESVRLAQRSITLRKVMKEIQFDCGDTVYTVQPGVYITTMLSVINTQTPELARFDPDHYQGRRIDPALIAQGKETISTFGHGLHACPAQKFSHNMCKVLMFQLLENFEFGKLEAPIAPSSSQMGGVARAASDVMLHYSRKTKS